MNDTATGRAILDELRPLHREMRRAVPEVYRGFGALSEAALGAGALDVKSEQTETSA